MQDKKKISERRLWILLLIAMIGSIALLVMYYLPKQFHKEHLYLLPITIVSALVLSFLVSRLGKVWFKPSPSDLRDNDLNDENNSGTAAPVGPSKVI